MPLSERTSEGSENKEWKIEEEKTDAAVKVDVRGPSYQRHSASSYLTPVKSRPVVLDDKVVSRSKNYWCSDRQLNPKLSNINDMLLDQGYKIVYPVNRHR